MCKAFSVGLQLYVDILDCIARDLQTNAKWLVVSVIDISGYLLFV